MIKSCRLLKTTLVVAMISSCGIEQKTGSEKIKTCTDFGSENYCFDKRNIIVSNDDDKSLGFLIAVPIYANHNLKQCNQYNNSIEMDYPYIRVLFNKVYYNSIDHFDSIKLIKTGEFNQYIDRKFDQSPIGFNCFYLKENIANRQFFCENRNKKIIISCERGSSTNENGFVNPSCYEERSVDGYYYKATYGKMCYKYRNKISNIVNSYINISKMER